MVAQLVVTTSLLFQQCPVLALGAPDLNQPDNEVTESAGDQGDEAVARNTDSAEISVSDDSVSAVRAVDSIEPSTVPIPSNPGVWKTVGSCLWMIDESGLMTIEPQGDGVGCIDYSEAWRPWNADRDSNNCHCFSGRYCA